MKAKDFDKKFEEGQDICKYLLWILHSLDKEAKRLGVLRQSIIKVWVAERLEKSLS